MGNSGDLLQQEWVDRIDCAEIRKQRNEFLAILTEIRRQATIVQESIDIEVYEKFARDLDKRILSLVRKYEKT